MCSFIFVCTNSHWLRKIALLLDRKFIFLLKSPYKHIGNSYCVVHLNSWLIYTHEVKEKNGTPQIIINPKYMMHTIYVSQSQFIYNYTLFSRNLLFYPEWLYRLSPSGKEFFNLCDYVHQFAEDIIEKRKTELVWI